MFTYLPRTFFSFASLLFSFLLASVNIATNPLAILNKPVAAPDDFTPVVRFAVCSDIHITGTDDTLRIERFTNLIETAYDIAESDSKYTKLDAVCVCGDFTDSGSVAQFEAFKKVLDENIREGTTALTVVGNHEFFDNREETFNRFNQYVLKETDNHFVINGFHFIGISYDQDTTFGIDKMTWLDKQLAEAKQDNPDYPIFVFQHPHPFGTVYGSVNWGEINLNAVYVKYPQVVNFSGHSHYPMRDPRSVWQGSFTALGTGSLDYYELENELFAGQFPEGHEKAAEFYIVEADANGSTRVRGYDLNSATFIDGVDHFFKSPAKKSTFTHTYAGRFFNSTAPAFENGAEVSLTVNEDGEAFVGFPAAKDKSGVVHDYKISVTCELKKVYSGNVVANYYNIPEKDYYSVNVGSLDLESGKTYTVNVIAGNSFYQVSKPLSGSFTF